VQREEAILTRDVRGEGHVRRTTVSRRSVEGSEDGEHGGSFRIGARGAIHLQRDGRLSPDDCTV
jgi:hypothetical protein